jgi:sugar lactone lactonase YvrE
MTDLDTPVELVWDIRCETGESCTWDSVRRRVLFCDIPAGLIHSLSPADGARQTWRLPELVASFGVCRSGKLVVALRSRVVLFDPETSALTELSGPLDQPATVRLNDGKVGPDGCFWVGGRDESPAKTAEAALWRITPDGRAERKAEGYQTCNGLAWSPDETIMYHTDSRRGQLDAWDFAAATGAIANRRRLATLTDAEGRPDGGATDAEGCYWSAGTSAACLNRFSPTGELLARVKLTVPAPSMPCFAGEWMYLTTLREGRAQAVLDANPTMGGLFRLRAPVAGSPVAVFAD